MRRQNTLASAHINMVLMATDIVVSVRYWALSPYMRNPNITLILTVTRV